MFCKCKKKKNLFSLINPIIDHYSLISYPLVKDVTDVIKTVRGITTPLLDQHKQSFDQHHLRLGFFRFGKYLFTPPKLKFSNPLIFQIMNSYTVSPSTSQTTK